MNMMVSPRSTAGFREYPTITREQAEKFLPAVCRGEMDPYFPKRGAMCGEEHLKYVLQLMYPLHRMYLRVIVTRTGMCTYALIATFAVGDRDLDHLGPGHIRFVGDPGTGKSLLGGVAQRVVGSVSKRVQGTSDLQPGDITGTDIVQVDETGKRIFEFVPGPVFSNQLLFDEQSRAGDRAQAALLQSMSEGIVTVNGVTRPANPQVIGTDNTKDSAGVRELPDAMLDRIMFQIPAEHFTGKEFSEILRRARQFHHIKLEQICEYERVNEARRFFHDTIYVSSELEEFTGILAETLNGVDRLGLMGPVRKRLKFSDHEDLVKPGSMVLSGRGITHLEGASRTLAAYRYRNFLTKADVQKVLKPVIRHRARFTTNALSVQSREMVRDELKRDYEGFGKTEMAEYLLTEIIDAAWQHVSPRKE